MAATEQNFSTLSTKQHEADTKIVGLSKSLADLNKTKQAQSASHSQLEQEMTTMTEAFNQKIAAIHKHASYFITDWKAISLLKKLDEYMAAEPTGAD